MSLGAPEPWDICHSAALLAGPCRQPCTGINLCRVQHCRALGALSLPHTLLASLCSLLAFPLLSPHPHLFPRGSLSVHLEPLFLAAAPQGGPWGSPSFPLALGSGGILHPSAIKGQSRLPGASSPREPLSVPTSSLETCCAIGAIPGKCSCHIYLLGCRGFQASSPEPFPSIHMCEALPNRLRGE